MGNASTTTKNSYPGIIFVISLCQRTSLPPMRICSPCDSSLVPPSSVCAKILAPRIDNRVSSWSSCHHLPEGPSPPHAMQRYACDTPSTFCVFFFPSFFPSPLFLSFLNPCSLPGTSKLLRFPEHTQLGCGEGFGGVTP